MQPIDEEEGIRAVEAAFQRGINFFDTSPFSGDTRSERVLGKALKRLPRDKIVVATKVGRYGQDTFDFSASRVTASIQESLTRLQLEYVDLIQCHDIEFGDLDQIIEETLPALAKLREKGLVKNVGITGLPLKIFTYILDR
jgi:L-galactose dehydrogenase